MRRFSMASVRGLGWLAVVLAAVNVSRGQTQLKLKFVEGETLRFVQETEFHMNVGSEEKAAQRFSMEMTTHVDSVDEQGVATLTQSIVRIKGSQLLPPPIGKEVSFDTDKLEEPEAENPDDKEMADVAKVLAEAVSPMVGGKTKIKVSPYGEISGFEPDDRLSQYLRSLIKQSADESDAEGLYDAGMQGFKAQITRMIQPLPSKEIQKGEKWQHTFEMDLPLGPMHEDYVYTYQGAEGNLERIGVSGEVRMNSNEKSPVKLEIGDQSFEGYLLFDNVAGRLAKAVIKQKYQVRAVDGREGTLDCEQAITIRLVDGKTNAASDDSGKEKPKKKNPRGKVKIAPAKPDRSP